MGEGRQEPANLAIHYFHGIRKYPISKLCAALHILRCSYYKWLNREENSNELLTEQIIGWIKSLYHFYNTKRCQKRLHCMTSMEFHAVA